MIFIIYLIYLLLLKSKTFKVEEKKMKMYPWK